MHWIIKILFSLLVITGISGCLPFEKELQMMLHQHYITQKMYLKINTKGYDNYQEDKKAIALLTRAEYFKIVDIKENYARLEKSHNNTLIKDVWVPLKYLEKEPTYFLKLTTTPKNAKILVNGKKYNYIMRLPKGKYTITVSAERFLDQNLEIDISQDITQKIDLNIDTVAQKIIIAQEKAKQKKIAALEVKIKKVTLERKNSIYNDTKQNLMWQDDFTTEKIQRPWITEENHALKNYADTSGETAHSYCKKLNLAGFNDWRLPSKNELKVLYTQNHSLKKSTSNWYWSSTSNDKIIDRAWAIYFKNGDGFSDHKSIENFVRCVRVDKR